MVRHGSFPPLSEVPGCFTLAPPPPLIVCVLLVVCFLGWHNNNNTCTPGPCAKRGIFYLAATDRLIVPPEREK